MSHNSTAYNVQLPAAEETISFPKEKVFLLERGEVCAHTHVVFDDKVKTLIGLQLPSDFMSKDYYLTFEKVNEQAKKMRQMKWQMRIPTIILSAVPSHQSGYQQLLLLMPKHQSLLLIKRCNKQMHHYQRRHLPTHPLKSLR